MTIAIALLIALTLPFVLGFIFLMTVYLKEYRREQRLIEEQLGMKKESYAQAAAFNEKLQSVPVVYLDASYAAPLAPKKKKPAIDDLPAINTKEDKAKKVN